MSIFKRLLAIFGKAERKPERVPEPVIDASVTPFADSAELPAERRSRKRADVRRGVCALIIDDSPTIVAALRKILRSAGYLTLEAPDAEKGLELVLQEKPDMIFLDIILPGMNGFAAVRTLRKDPLTQHIPIIMISGNEHAAEQFYANRIGADDFMKKPFSRVEVFARVECLLDAEGIPRRKTFLADSGTTPPVASAPPVSPAPATVSPAPAPKPQAIPVVSAAASEARMAALEARKALTAMGLQYFEQGQFIAAIQRADKLAVELFILGGGVSLKAPDGGKSPLDVAQETAGSGDIAALLQKHGAQQGLHAAHAHVALHAVADRREH